jgi:hypothetical protein
MRVAPLITLCLAFTMVAGCGSAVGSCARGAAKVGTTSGAKGSIALAPEPNLFAVPKPHLAPGSEFRSHLLVPADDALRTHDAWSVQPAKVLNELPPRLPTVQKEVLHSAPAPTPSLPKPREVRAVVGDEVTGLPVDGIRRGRASGEQVETARKWIDRVKRFCTALGTSGKVFEFAGERLRLDYLTQKRLNEVVQNFNERVLNSGCPIDQIKAEFAEVERKLKANATRPPS